MAIACSCHAVRDGSVREAIDAGAHTVDAVMEVCGAGTNCGGCVPTLEQLLCEAGVGETAVALSVSAA